MINSPFKFLDSYTKDDASIFFGREKETEELYRKIFENKTLLVYGVSGTGKTSIINCGLANKFNDADWLPVTIRRNQNMVESFYAALHKLSPDTKDKGKRDAKAFIKLLQSVYLDHFKPVYLLFDQFEELFIFGDEEEQKAFVDIIAEIKASDVQVKILFIMREEYLANMSAFEEKIPDLLTNRLRIEKMSTAKVKEAITGPCKYAGIEIENEAVEAIIEKLTRQGKTIELTYLQVLLDRLFHKAAQEQKGDNLQFTQSLVASLGEVSDILGDFLEEQIRQFDNPDQVLDVLKSFVSIRGTKRQSTVEEIGNHLRSLNKAQETDTLQSTIQQLVNLRILREKDENDRYELRHDALAAKIFEKISIVEKEIFEVREFIENAFQSYKKRGVLLNKKDLEYIDKYAGYLFLSPEPAKFVKASRDYLKRKFRAVRWIQAVTGVVFLLTLVFIFMYVNEQGSKQRAEDMAVSSMMKMQSIYNRHKKATEAWEEYQSPITRKAVYDLYFDMLEDDRFSEKLKQDIPVLDTNAFPIVDIQFTRDDQRIVGYDSANRICIWELPGGMLKNFDPGLDSITYMQISRTGKYVATLTDSNVYVWHETSKLQFKKPIQKKDYPFNVVKFINTHEQIAVLDAEGNWQIVNMQGEPVQIFKNDTAFISNIDISPNERFMASADTAGYITAYYFNKKRKQYDLYNSFNKSNGQLKTIDFSKDNRHLLSLTIKSYASYAIQTLNGEIAFDRPGYYLIAKPINMQFSQSGQQLIFYYKNLKSKDQRVSFYKNRLLYDKAKDYKKFQTAFPAIVHKFIGSRFEKISVSSNNHFVNVKFPEKDQGCLMSIDGALVYKQYPGHHMTFSNDARYFARVNQNNVHLVFLDMQTIMKRQKMLIDEYYQVDDKIDD